MNQLSVAVDSLEADTQWFHVFKSMIESGELANISGSALKVYLVIKSYSNYKSGASFPAETTVAEKSGLSISQVKRAVKELRQLAYLSVTKSGRKNHYILRERVVIRNGLGDSAAHVTWDYVPSGVTAAVEELKNYVQTGQIDGKQIINIQNLQVNINQVGSGGIVVNNQVLNISHLDPGLRKKLGKMLGQAGFSVIENDKQLIDDTCHE